MKINRRKIKMWWRKNLKKISLVFVWPNLSAYFSHSARAQRKLQRLKKAIIQKESLFQKLRNDKPKQTFKLQFKNLKKLFHNKVILRRATAIATLLATIAVTYFQLAPQSQSASYTFAQSAWTSQTANDAAHPTNSINWSEYSAKDAGITAGTEVALTANNYTATDDGTFSSTGSATGGGFANGANTDTQVTGAGTDASVELVTGNASTTKTSDTDFADGTHAGTQTTGTGDTASLTLQTQTASTFTHTLDADFAGTHTNTATTSNSIQLQAGQTSGTYESPTVDLGASAARADLTTASIEQITSGGATVKAWGYNGNGQLGNGTTTQSTVPVQTSSLVDVVAVAAGAVHSLALKSDGTVWAWGYNGNGQLGNGTTTQSTIPVQTSGLTNIVAIATGETYNGFSMALKSDGTVWAWGYNGYGQLGNGTTTQSTVPVQASGLNNVIAIAAGGHEGHSLALKSDGTVWAWGNNGNGQLGNGTIIRSIVPVQTSGLTDVVAIATGGYSGFSMALKSDGTVWAWGYNGQGQLGDNTTTQRLTPVQVKGVGGVGYLTNITAISVGGGEGHSLALKSDGTVWAWGINSWGELGNGDYSYAPKYTPVQVKGVGNSGYLTNVVAIASGGKQTYPGGGFSLALKSDGTVFGWGRGGEGQIGDNNTIARYYVPVQVKGVGNSGYLTNVVAIAAGGNHSIAITGGASFQMAAKDTDADWLATDFKALPRQVGSSPKRLTIPSDLDGRRYVRYKAYLTTEDVNYSPSLNEITINLQNQGSFTSGAINLGGEKEFDGRSFIFSTTIPAEIAGNRVQVQLSKDNTTWYGSGGGTGSKYDSTTCSVATGTYTCAYTSSTASILNNTSTLYYKVFLSSSNTSYAPTFDSLILNYHTTYNGTFESATIDLGGKANLTTATLTQTIPAGATKNYAWGSGAGGQLGDNTTVGKIVPVETSGLTNAVAIAGGVQHELAVKTDGTVWAWGDNQYGKLGDNTTTQRNAPVQVLGPSATGYLTDVVAVAAGNTHSLALKSDGTVWAWGSNNSGQLGDNTYTQRNTPVQVKGVGGTGFLADIVAVTAGNSYSLALKSDGTVWTWGANSSGQLGDNTATTRNTPVQVFGTGAVSYLTDVVAVAAGNNYALALKADGTVWAWGDNGYGKLGDNTQTNRYTPVQVKGVGGVGFLTDIVSIAAGKDSYTHSLALKADGTVWAWGSNGYYGFGNGNFTNSNTPVQSSITNVVAISVGFSGSLALKADGTVWGWGNNTSGNVGDNTNSNKSLPTQTLGLGGVGYLTGVVAISMGASNSYAIVGGNRLQIATKDTDAGWVAGNYKEVYRHPGSANRLIIPNTADGHQFLRYKATLATADPAYAPTFDSLTLNYVQYPTTPQTLTSSKYNSTDAANTPASLRWTEAQGTGTDLKFQLRTSLDGNSWTAWCGPENGTPGTCNSATYFTDPAGTEIVDDINSDQSNDQWMQYQVTLTSDGTYTPTLSDATLTYVVNATPELQMVTASQAANGLVTVNYQVRDPDTTTGFTADEVAIGLQYCTANCSIPGGETWADATTLTGNYGAGVATQEVNWNSYALVWNSKADYPNQTNATDFKVRVKANDSEAANNLGYGQSNTFNFDTVVPPEVQTVTASQGANGLVTVNYEVKDVDTTNAVAATPGLVNITLQYCTANCATPGGETWIDATTVTGDGSIAVTDSFVAKELTWTAKTDYANQYNATNFKIRVKADDSETLNNLGYAQSSVFTVDTTNPANVSLAINHTQTTNQLTMSTPTDDSSYQMLLSNLADFADATPQAFSSPFTYNSLTTDPATVYLRILDAYGNYTDIARTTPMAPQDLVYYDTSNSNLNEYREFLAWGVVSPSQVGDGFASYEVYRSTDNTNFTNIGSVADRNTNFYTDTTVVADTHYYYKVTTKDINNNISNYSATVDDIPNGQGGTDSTAPTQTNVQATEINTTSAKITWTTDELSDSSVGFSSQADCDASPGQVCPYLPERGIASMVTSHEIMLTNLDPDTSYNIRVKAHDQIGNLAQNDKDNPGATPIPSFTFHTLPGPAISGVSVYSNNNQATVSWVTTTDSDTYVIYSDTIANNQLVNPMAVGTLDRVGGTSAYNHTQLLNTYNDNPLIPGTTYYFYVTSKDATDNVASDNNGGIFYSFTTTQDDDAPIISNVNEAILNNTQAGINWVTNEPADSKVVYGTKAGGPYDFTEILTTYDTSHFVIISGLTPETDYYYQVISKDINGNETTSTEETFVTMPDPQFQHAPISTISNIDIPTEIISDTHAVVNFDTDQPAICYAKLTTAQGSYTNPAIVQENGYVQESYSLAHSISFIDLIPTTNYYFFLYCHDNLLATEGSLEISSTTESEFVTSEKLYTEAGAGMLGDKTAPVISGVSTKVVSGESVVVSWETDEISNSNVSYGVTSGTYENGAVNDLVNSDVANYVTTHEVTVNNLSPGAKYYFLVRSVDVSGNIASSTEQSFTTSSASNLSGINLTSSKLGEITIAWKSSTKTTSIVEYGTTEIYGEIKQSNTPTQEHLMTVSGLQQNTEYYFIVKGKDEINNLYSSQGFKFTPKSPPVISSATIDTVTEHGATIKFNTNIPTDALITYTSDDNSGFQGKPDLAVTHEIELVNLPSGTTYTTSLKVRDADGNETTLSGPNFTTGKDENAPKIDQVRTDSALAQNDKVQTIISWTTDEPATTELIYSEGRNAEKKAIKISNALTTSHIAVITTFKAGVVYYFQVKSTDLSENAATSTDYALLTPKRKENVIQIIINNFQDIFSWAK